MVKIFIFLFFFFFCGHVLVQGQPDIKTDWNAKWIGSLSSSVPNTFVRYRHSFDLSKIPVTAVASIATDSKYWLWLNGKLVVFEGQLKRGPTPEDTYYDEVNLKPWLQEGKNTVAILVWYWGKNGFGHNNSGRSGLLFEARLDNDILTGNKDWKTAPHLAYQNSLPPHPNFRLPEFNIHYDARIENEDWIKPDFNDTNWAYANEIANAGAAPWNALWKRPIPLWHNSGLVQFEDKAVVSGDTMILKLPKNISITPYFKIEAPPGLLVDIRTDNYKGGSEPNIRTEYVTKNGVQEFETPAYMNGHEVRYFFPAGIKVLDLEYRETKYNTENIGYFKSSDPFLNKLWHKSFTTLIVNLRDGIYDSPDRERAQWWGDIVIVLEEIFYSCDEKGKLAVSKAISNLVEWQRKDSVLFSPIPAGNWNKELPAQMLAAVSKYGIWKYIEYSGDTAMIPYVYPHIKKYMALWQLDEKGLVMHRSGDWDWHDWGDKIDAPLLDNAWYYMALESTLKMAEYLHAEKDVSELQYRMKSIKENFQKYFWKGNRFMSNDYEYYADDRGNGLAVCAGLVNAEQWSKMKPVLDTTFHAGPYLEKYVLESYFIMNDVTAGIRRMKNRYADMVNHPWITTLWEGWEIGSRTFGGGTYNHGWTGGPLSLLSGYVAGIRPTGIGYTHYQIKPQPGLLEELSAGAFTAKGYISMEFTCKGNKTKMVVETLPVEGIIALPKAMQPYRKLRINGQRKNKSIRLTKEDENYIYFSCNTSGHFIIEAE